jgi:hypothetical protein
VPCQHRAQATENVGTWQEEVRDANTPAAKEPSDIHDHRGGRKPQRNSTKISAENAPRTHPVKTHNIDPRRTNLFFQWTAPLKRNDTNLQTRRGQSRVHRRQMALTAADIE